MAKGFEGPATVAAEKSLLVITQDSGKMNFETGPNHLQKSQGQSCEPV